jgi:hypothetical protein
MSNTHAEGPWHLKRSGAANQPTYTLHDLHGNTIATLSPPDNPDRSYTPEQFRNTMNLLLRAPILLAALMEYALHEDVAHQGITQELCDLIRECGGRDLHSRVKSPDGPAVNTEPKTLE